jgi:hypothetical protein
VRQFWRILLFVVAIACSSQDPEKAGDGKSFIPLQVGTFQTYSVDEIQYTPLADPVELHYELKTAVIDSFLHGEGGYAYVIHRSKRAVETDPWEYLDTWSARVNDREVVVNEANISFVKLALPIAEGKVWNGNKFNSGDEDEYEMSQVGLLYSVGDTDFSSALLVDQENRVDLLFNERRFEVYAENIGLIYKETTDLEYCNRVDCFGQNEIEQGIIYKQSITGYGKL